MNSFEKHLHIRFYYTEFDSYSNTYSNNMSMSLKIDDMKRVEAQPVGMMFSKSTEPNQISFNTKIIPGEWFSIKFNRLDFGDLYRYLNKILSMNNDDWHEIIPNSYILDRLVQVAKETAEKNHDSLFSTSIDNFLDYGDSMINVIQENPYEGNSQIVNKAFPVLQKMVAHPMLREEQKMLAHPILREEPLVRMPLQTVIISLNDQYKWSREQIADWLETLDVDIQIKDDDV